MSLQKLETDRFASARLVGKLANICPDLPSSHLTGTSVFKALTGGDRIGSEFKYRDSFEFVPFVKLIFSANQPPRSKSKAELQAELDEANDRVEELEAKLDDIAGLASGEDEDDEDEDLEDGDEEE